MVQPHVLLVVFPAQGHINPYIQLAKRLVAIGVEVTFTTSYGADHRMAKTRTPKGLYFATFSDGHDDCYEQGNDLEQYFEELRRHGSQSLSELILAKEKSGHAFTWIVYCFLLPWVAKVAHDHHLPSTLLYSQPMAVLEIYYYYFNGHGGEIEKNVDDPTFSLKLPGLPALGSQDIPSFFLPTNVYAFTLPLVKEHLEMLEKEQQKPEVLINTFDALECESLASIGKYKMIGVGPLIPSAFLDGKDPSDTSYGGDLAKGSKDDMEWLNTKPESSVVYISFGSISKLSKPQMEEIARALLDTGHPFLWVIRGGNAEEISCFEQLEQQGMIVRWCSQVEVLFHPSLGCFMTHCGWNSTSESLAAGVPVVAFPQWTDQLTNSKLVQDLWKTGLKVSPNKEGVVEREEIKRCLDLVMGDGEEGKEMRKNAKKWKELARDASTDGGSSDRNLKAFVGRIRELGGGGVTKD